MRNFIFGVMLLSFIGCASLEEQNQLKAEAEQMELGDRWWNNNRSFDSLEEAKHFVDVLFVKTAQITRLNSSKGLNGFLEPAGTGDFWTPADEKVSGNWSICISRGEGQWLDLSKEQLGFCHSAILYATVWYKGKGIILSWYGIESGWSFSNNVQLSRWNDNTVCDYPIGLTRTRAWEHLGYGTI
jgi:hypothetical protein